MYPILIKRPACSCEYCGRDLFEGDELYNIEGDKVCDDCVNEWMQDQLNDMRSIIGE